MELAAILISPKGATGALRSLLERLGELGVAVTIVDELATAAEASERHAAPPALLLDLREAGAGEIEDQRVAGEAIRRTLVQLPSALPIVVTSEADPMLIVSCIRAGAADVIDLQLEGIAAVRAVIKRVCERQAQRAHELDQVAAQRDLIEDLVKDLIRTERRAIDGEHALAATRKTAEQAASALESRPPAVMLIEHQRQVADQLAELLEAEGVSTFAYVTGEEALRDIEAISRTSGLDLALVASELPGIDGVETVRRLQGQLASLPAFLMTSVHDGDLADLAAELGVAGFVKKPLADLDLLVSRLVQLARDSLHRTREHVYLQRIKERHERVLARYRSLPREP